MYERKEPTREERKLRRLIRAGLGGRQLGDVVASTSEATADLFASEYSPETELGEEIAPWEKKAE
jgi:hypothetical protein